MPEIEYLRQSSHFGSAALGQLTGVTSGAGLPREVVETMYPLQAGPETSWKAVRVERFLRRVEPRPLSSSLGRTMDELPPGLIVPPATTKAALSLSPPVARRPIEEVLARLAAEVPEEEWRKVPADLADNLDHYVYGTPKR